MTSRELTIRRDHLIHHRRMIIGRSIAASIAGALPVPVLDTRLSFLIQRSTLRQIARSSQVDFDEAAAESLIYGRVEPPKLVELAGQTLAFRVLARTWRKALMAYMAVRRARVASRNFLLATLFDHYCAKLHVGLGLDAALGAELRAAMDEAMACTPGGLSQRMFRRALSATARATVRAPLELLDMASRGVVRKLLSSRSSDEIEAAAEIETQLDHQLRSKKSFLARAATAVELQLSVDENPYLDLLIENFERIWRERRENPHESGE
ncbi:MAG: hypothetical protein MJE77_05260 [Proteobacteria bacterium]|nr:hypothetical protein [Pseudomonadota bacterium]